MRLVFTIFLLALGGCSLTLKPSSLWAPTDPVALGTVSYEWPASLVVDAINDAIIDEGGVIIRNDINLGTSHVSFSGPYGPYIAEITVVRPNSTTVTLTHPADSIPTDGMTQGFFMAVDHRLGLR